MKTVFICSPYRADPTRYSQIAREMCLMAIREKFAPIAPHLLYPQFLDDSSPGDRNIGIFAGLTFLKLCDAIWIYSDEPLSDGMRFEVAYAIEECNMTVRWVSHKMLEDQSA